MAIVTDVSSKDLNKNTQLNTRKKPHANVCSTSLLLHFSVLYWPDASQQRPKNSVAQRQRTKTNSNDGRLVCSEKKPIEPKITMEMTILITAVDFCFGVIERSCCIKRILPPIMYREKHPNCKVLFLFYSFLPAVQPPSMTKFEPVIKCASSEAKYFIQETISLGCPHV